jgi:hypothetical protein
LTKLGDIDLVGHINLNRSMDVAAEKFIRLVEVLDGAEVSQHVIVANEVLARRVAVYPSVSIGPVTCSAVMACCMMPRVDIVHAHGDHAGHAGLLLALTRSIPYVMTSDAGGSATEKHAQRAVSHRSMHQLDVGGRLDAAKVLRIYNRAVAKWRSQTMLV